MGVGEKGEKASHVGESEWDKWDQSEFDACGRVSGEIFHEPRRLSR